LSIEERVDEALMESFPASDPPAVHVSDRPPANAQAKWDAAAVESQPKGGSSSAASEA
jgi:hypothetical protein